MRADDVGDGVIELLSGTGEPVDEDPSEGGVWVSVDLEVQVFGGAEGVFGAGRDPEGVLVDDGDATSWFIGAIPAGDLVAVRDGYGDIRH
ncbi:hypothetical protein NDU88_005561 [Pleurodeles waltl]|uniref:Uncharacterized protein n=1 Tax=Pleurodeles waltl TaxID=8319 RepID=A0AAV7X1K3_PLEWA|nr:hypothetical protein NDU88_005561 [Pleurodeles waltl]